MTLLAPIMMRSGFMNVKNIIETTIENIKLNIKLPSKFVKMFEFNDFVFVVSVSHEKTSLRSKAERRAKGGLKARNISGSIASK